MIIIYRTNVAPACCIVMLMSARPLRGNDDTINDDRLEAHCLFSTGGRVRSVHRVVSMVSVS